jgi:hypothetical protein
MPILANFFRRALWAARRPKGAVASTCRRRSRPLRMECLETRSYLAVAVYLNFPSPDFENRLHEACQAVTPDPQPDFQETDQVKEISAIKANIETRLASIYANVPGGFTFSTTDPGGDREIIQFGNTDSDGYYGNSHFLDWLNQVTQTVDVYPGNFGPVLTESGVPNRVNNISWALANTAAHELGHALGLTHEMAYGRPELNPSNTIYDANPPHNANWNGIQNQDVMATGPTGQSSLGFMSPSLTFSTLDMREFAFADDLGGQSSITEQSSAHSSRDTAEPLTLDYKKVGDIIGSRQGRPNGSFAAAGEPRMVNIHGTDNGDGDVYSFAGRQGDLLTVLVRHERFASALLTAA